MNKDNSIYIRQMLDSINLIEEFSLGYDLEKFLNDLKTQNSVAFQIQIIGEAANQTEIAFQQQFPNIPWKEIIRIRHKIVHHYMDIDPEIVWEIVETELPKLKQNLKKILDQ